VSDERGAPDTQISTLVPSSDRPGDQQTSVFCGALARGWAEELHPALATAKSRSYGALLSAFLTAKHDDP